MSKQTDKISRQPENWENRNGPDCRENLWKSNIIHKLFIIPKLHTQQHNIFQTNLTLYSICVVVYIDGYSSLCTSYGGRHGGTRQWDTLYLFPRRTRSRNTWSFVFLTCDVFMLITDTLIYMRYNNTKYNFFFLA